MTLLAQTLALLAMTVVTVAVKVVPLDMAHDSFNDQHWDCSPAMIAKLPALHWSESQQNPLFAQAWPQAIAVMDYMMDDLYKEFNKAVRTAGSSSQEYQNNFHFKTLHFLLTDILVMLRNTWGPGCHYVYRGVRWVWFKAEHGDIVGFGQFTSASQSEGTAKVFGTDTVFHVHTWHSVEIQNFSYYPHEKEVLIPLFETFEVIKVSQEGESAWIQLRSTGTFSNYNCEWLRGGSVPRAPFQLRGLLLGTTATGIL
ncbi:NAD(P)(+)--arginine ADP-ribosyltransferase 2-like [Motacilla alba alba]|uniref:NAD(P)(+)--arginine ADP-ribosyltransferase 2-like n=1 Tax=Motacilla alba alba TaxID=1094192 RepID=UPI0018D5A2EB|nr:NAD(P)(+)--arginine ADP-ribosyltransferase 2-like [Motacilla alba alba]